LAFAEATDGVFDPCLENTVVLWDVGHRRTPLDESRTRPLAGRRLYTRLALDLSDEGGVATLESPDAGVDLGGIAKGHAVDLAARALRRHGMEDGLVNVGGDLVALGVSPDGDSWRVGVRDPDDPHGVARVLEARDEAIATSGDYEAGFWYGGHRYHHLIDPRTARPGGGRRRSVTVRARTCLEADAAATAAFLMDERAAAASLPAAAPGVQVVVRL
jgi:thiamine biosynthesis lipoprotein